MPLPATTEHQDVTTDAKPKRERRISARMQQALSHLATKGVNQREASKLAGISEYHLSRELKKPQIQAFIARKARENIAVGVLRASNRVLELVDASSEHVSLDAAKHVLAIEGIRAPSDSQVSVNVGVSVGYVLDLREPTETNKPPELIAHQRHIDANPLIDHGSVRQSVQSGMGRRDDEGGGS